MIQRPEYLKFLIEWKDKQIIKVISGIRRCGKSTLFDLFKQYLTDNGTQPNQIISLNFEEPDNDYLLDYKALYNFIKSKLVDGKMNYVFLDEIQHVKNFEKAVDGLFIKPNVDVYITGSNSKFMSGELATLLSGRYIELKMLPLSFKEYVSAFDGSAAKEVLYQNYLHNGSFPYTINLADSKDIYTYLDGIYNTIVMKDIVERAKITDISKFKSFVKFMFSNVGNTFSAKKIADTMTSMNRKISAPTIENYLEAITDSFLMYKVQRYDIKGKEYLQLMEKYYLSDIGLRYYLLGTKDIDMGHILENVVYLELLRRGYRVYIGRIDSNEVDFVCQNIHGDTEYYQVALTVRDEKTLARELAPLDKIPDHNPKYLITMDIDPPTSHNGIKQIYALDWLLS